MTAMRAVAHVVEEDHPEISIRADRLGEKASIKVLMAARLQHDGASVLVRVLFQPGPTLDNGCT